VNDILKQRLIGATILLALGVVFWPIIFVQPEHKGATQPQSLPPPPPVSTAPVEPPDASGLRTSPDIAASTQAENTEEPATVEKPAAVAIPAVQPKPTPATSGTAQSKPSQAPSIAAQPKPAPPPAALTQGATPATRSKAPEPLVTDANGVPQAWTLQVATVASADKAENMRKRLIAMQQKAYVTSVSSGGNRLYRVCVGPKFERAELAALQTRINAEFGVTTMIVRYVP
jgi:DedD protein